MRRPHVLAIALLSIASVTEAGVILYLLRGHRVTKAAEVVSTAVSHPSVPSIRNQVSDHSVTESGGDDVRRPLSADVADESSVAVVLAELTKRRGVRASVRFLNADGSISDSFAELFALSGDERRALEEAVSLCRREVSALLEGHARVVQQASGAVEIAIDPFETEGAQLHDVLSARIERVLGNERMVAFARLTGSQLDDAFDYFGAAARTLTITPATSSDGVTRYTVLDHSDHGGESSMSSAEYEDIQQLVRANPNFADILRKRFSPR